MTRIKLDRPTEFHFLTGFEIGVSQLNYGNHLSNEQILVLAHESRLRFFKSLGADEFDFWGANLIQSDAAIEYTAEGHYGDQIEVYLMIEDISRVAFDVKYVMYNATSKKELAVAKTGIVCFNYKTKKVLDVPTPFKDILNSIVPINFQS